MRYFLWIQLGVGAFVAVFPAMLGISGNTVMFWGNVFAGVTIMLISLWLLFGES